MAHGTEELSYVFHVQRYSLHDGPGIRTIVFLKGCPLRCRWCCNPESQGYEREISYVAGKCIGLRECGFCREAAPEGAVTFPEGGKARLDMGKCAFCLRCADVCPSKAIEVVGKSYGARELIDIVEQDAVFYQHGDGGLTVSGGEPLTHREFLLELLEEAKRRRITTAIETCGHADYGTLFEAAGYLDTIMYDIKSMDGRKHKEYTGKDNARILDNFKRLCEDYPDLPKRVRTPVIPGFNDNREEIARIRSFLSGKPNVEYELLPYHSFGRGKYAALGREYPMGDAKLREGLMEELGELLQGAGSQKEEEKTDVENHEGASIGI